MDFLILGSNLLLLVLVLSPHTTLVQPLPLDTAVEEILNIEEPAEGPVDEIKRPTLEDSSADRTKRSISEDISADIIEPAALIDTVHERVERRAPNLHVNVQIAARPETIELHPGKTIRIRCIAQAQLTIDDYLYVSFFRQFGEYTHMPLSSGDPGITVEPTVPREEDLADFEDIDDPDVVHSVKVLTLGPEAYDALDNGQNLFYCKAATRSGVRDVSYFFVKRINRPARRQPRFRRWTPPPRVI